MGPPSPSVFHGPRRDREAGDGSARRNRRRFLQPAWTAVVGAGLAAPPLSRPVPSEGPQRQNRVPSGHTGSSPVPGIGGRVWLRPCTCVTRGADCPRLRPSTTAGEKGSPMESLAVRPPSARAAVSLVVLVALSAATAVGARGDGGRFTSTRYGYSLTVPAGWVVHPSAAPRPVNSPYFPLGDDPAADRFNSQGSDFGTIAVTATRVRPGLLLTLGAAGRRSACS
jgi:hypothetical protein